MRKATETEVQMYSDCHKDVYGVRPCSASLEEIADFFDSHYDEPAPVTFSDGSVHLIRQAKPWLSEQWEREANEWKEVFENEKWEEAIHSGDFNKLRSEIDGFLSTEQKPLVTIEF